MPSISKLVVVLPCHSLEDFPVHEMGEEAHSLLACWTAIWHPALIAHTGSMPTWVSRDYVAEDLDNSLILAPKSCQANLPEEITEATESEKAVLIGGFVKRSEALAASPIVELVGQPSAEQAKFVPDFFALGYAYLQVQLMTRQLRYSTTLNEDEFERRVLVAAESYSSFNADELSENLSACFDQLLEERNNFYPSEPNLLNLVLVPPTTSKLARQLEQEHDFNLLLDGNTLRELHDKQPEQSSTLRKKLEDKQVSVLMAGRHELPPQLVSMENVTNQAGLARNDCGTIFDKSSEPVAYGSFRFGLNAQLPNVIDQIGFQTAVHTVFSGGKIPVPSSPVINWQGTDGTTISALSATPIDANSAEGFLKLATTIGEMLDGYHHAELLFVQWPGRQSEWFDDLIRIEKYGPLFGKFKTVSEFCETIYDSGFSDNYASEDYQFQYLSHACDEKQVNPISRWVDFWSLNYRLRAMQKLVATAGIACPEHTNWEQTSEQLGELQCTLEQAASTGSPFETVDDGLSAIVKDQLKVQEFLPTEICNDAERVSWINPSEQPTITLAQNTGQATTSSIQPFSIATSHQDLVKANDPELASQSDDGEVSVRNEFFEVRFDQESGGVKSVCRYKNKRNMFSQQLACRLSRSGEQQGFIRHSSRYTKMVSTDIAISPSSNRHQASVTSSGYLLDETPVLESSETATVVEFQQTVTIRRGDACVYFDVELDPKTTLEPSPWRNYIASRLAWSDEDATVYRSENEIPDRVYQEKIVAPNYIEVLSGTGKLSLLTCGLPFHRRSSRRTLDSLLAVTGEQQKRFRFAVAVDAASSMATASLANSPVYASNSPAIANRPGWMFHLSSPNVIVTSMRPVFESGKYIGVVLRIQETEGRPGELKIRCPFRLKRATRQKFIGEPLFELPADDDTATCNFLELQYFEVKLCW